MQWGGQKWNLRQCTRSVPSSRNLLLGLTDFSWRAVWVAALRGNNRLWFLLKRDHSPDYTVLILILQQKNICKFTVHTLICTCSWLFSVSIEANQGFHSVTRSFVKRFLGVWCGAWTCFHTPDCNVLNHMWKLTTSYKYNRGGKMTGCFGMQRSHSEELSLTSRRWTSASELDWRVKLRMSILRTLSLAIFKSNDLKCVKYSYFN